VAVVVSPSVAVVVPGPSCSSAFGVDRAGALVAGLFVVAVVFLVDAVDLEVDALDLGLAAVDFDVEDAGGPDFSTPGISLEAR
jgi:hypothetical protein